MNEKSGQKASKERYIVMKGIPVKALICRIEDSRLEL